MAQSANSKTIYLQCEECDYKASRKDHLWRHVRAIHDEARDYQCEHCDYKASQKGHLFRHLNAKHGKRKDFACGQCDFVATRITYLKSHIQLAHKRAGQNGGGSIGSQNTGTKMEKCGLCIFTTASVEAITDHIFSTHEIK